MTKEELEKQTMEWKNNYILKLEKRCANYEMQISKMEKDTCDICKEREKDKRLAELEKEKCELLGLIQGKDKVIQDLQKKNAELETLTNSEHEIEARISHNLKWF